jgi:hypothetical protein
MSGIAWTRMLLAGGLLALSAAPAVAGDLTIVWDKDLAFEHDRANYERLLTGIVVRSLRSVTRGLGIEMRREPGIHVLSRGHYQQKFGPAAAGRGAHYHRGAIYVNGGNRLDQRFSGLMEHEMVHAVVDHRGTGHALPIWMNEGLAELFRWRHMGMRGLARNQIDELKRAGQRGALTPFPAGRGLTPYQYLQCYAIVLFIEEAYGSGAMQKLVSETVDGRSFERALKKVLRTEVRFLERAFVEWVKKLKP